MRVRDVVDLMRPGTGVAIADKNGNVLESECADYLTADYLECEVDVISLDNSYLWPHIVIRLKSLKGASLDN